MNQHFDRSTRCSATGVATGSILACIVAMAISVFFDFQPSGNSAHAAAAYSVSARALADRLAALPPAQNGHP